MWSHQGLLPLLVLSLPVGVFFAGVVSVFDMDLISLSLTFSVWSVPTVQVREIFLSFKAKHTYNIHDYSGTSITVISAQIEAAFYCSIAVV